MHVATILPTSYFDGLSTLWGGCAYVASAIVAAGLVFHALRSRPDPGAYLWLFAKVLLIGLSTAFLREWLMRLNDIVLAFGAMMRIDPRLVDNRFVEFVAGKTAASPNTSVWDVIWGTQSVGTAVTYALLWLFGWLSWGVQYVVKLIGGVLLTAGWALSPIFLSFFMLRPMVGVAQKYLIGLVALVCWPFGWVMAAVVTNAMLDVAASANLLPALALAAPHAAPALTVLLVGSWMLISSVLAPWVTTRVLLAGVNPAMAFAQGAGGVAQAAFTGGVGAGVAAATGGAAASAVVASAAAGVLSAGAESAARGGASARTTNTAIGGLSGLYSGSFMRRHADAAEMTASAQQKRAEATEAFASEFSEQMRRRKGAKGDFRSQPHHPDPNQAAINIQSNAKP